MVSTTRTPWPAVDYSTWTATCDTLHAHTQVLGKISLTLAPPEPELQHAALRLTSRGWETAPLPAPDGSGSLTVALDLRRHEALAEHSDGRERHVPLTPNRAVADVTNELLDAVDELVGPVSINPRPQETPWTTALNTDTEHATYDTVEVADYFVAATQAASALGAMRAPFRGRSTPVNAWWGSFDLAFSLFSGRPADPPARDFITRNSADAEYITVGWWPGDPRRPRAAFFAYAYPAPPELSDATLPGGGHWDAELGLYMVDWNDIRQSRDPLGVALEFGREVVLHACTVCNFGPALAASLDGATPPIR